MAKRYSTIEEKPHQLEEPAVACGGILGCVAPATDVSSREDVMASTMSVDEYFDKLIEQVHQDYAHL